MLLIVIFFLPLIRNYAPLSVPTYSISSRSENAHPLITVECVSPILGFNDTQPY